jgi:four helix bundle protein
MKENLIRSKSFQFSLDAIGLYKNLLVKHEFVLSKQFLRSATSIGANVEEAIAGQSRKDFIAKMSIASKESREANYWLRLIKASNITEYPLDPLIQESLRIINILSAIVKTSQLRKE